MSQSTPTKCTGPPKKFLKKGEGLKRFAAYKPPLPVIHNKAQRRQTFVKFKLDHNIQKTPKGKSAFLHPDILFDESINLSTEIPRIAPPKIMHTPIRPVRQALGEFKPSTLNRIIQEPEDTAPKRYNLRGTRKQASYPTEEPKSAPKKELRRGRRHIKAVVERHVMQEPNEPVINESQINGNIDCLLKKIEEKKTELDEGEAAPSSGHESDESHANPVTTTSSHQMRLNPTSDLSSPSPGSCILALGRQIQQIQATIHELKDRIEHCECGAYSTGKLASAGRSTRKSSKSKATDRTRPSACADNPSQTLNCLLDEITKLRERFDEVDLRH